MKKKQKIVLLLLIMIGTFFLWTGDSKAWGPPKKEDPAAFMKWYEENKDTDGAVYKLSGELYLSEGTEEAPILWDGQGEVTIDCGNYGVIVSSNVVIDNPNLTIKGSEYFIMLVQSSGTLTLEQGTIQMAEADLGIGRAAIIVQSGTIVPSSQNGQFRILGDGEDVTGICCTDMHDAELTNLNIVMKGSKRAIGIETAMLKSLTVENCNIQVQGKAIAYGVYGGVVGKLGMKVLIKNSYVTAAASNADGDAQSVALERTNVQEGGVQVEDSIMIPQASEHITYQITKKKAPMPVYVEPGNSIADWQMPSEVETYVLDKEIGRETMISIPVSWDMPEAGFEEPGYLVVQGSFDLQQSEDKIVNPTALVPEITVICLPPEKMFLITYETYEDMQGAKLVVPYPYGAETLTVEYSLDSGQTYTTYQSQSGSNLLGTENLWIIKGLYSFHLDLPIAAQDVYIRTIVEGDSMFSGISEVWKIGKKDNTDSSGDFDDSHGGDRGGQDSNPSFPDNGNSGGAEVITPSGENTPGTDDNQPVTGENQSNAGVNQQDGNNHDTVKEAHFEDTPKAQQSEANTYMGQASAGQANTGQADTGQANTGQADTGESNDKSDTKSSLKEASAKEILKDSQKEETDKQTASSKENSVEHASEKESEKIDNPKDTASSSASQWLTFLAAVLVIIAIAAGGLWCGSKIFKKKKSE